MIIAMEKGGKSLEQEGSEIERVLESMGFPYSHGSRVLTFLSHKKRGEKQVTIKVGESEISGRCVYAFIHCLPGAQIE